MKRILAFIMLLCLCIGLCACADEKSTETTDPTEPIETIDERPLLKDSDNGARAQMNIGKGTTIHGVITDIGTSSCTIQLILPKNTFVHVEMPTEQLAELNKNTFIAIEGVVTSFNANGDKKYTIRAKNILDIEEMDTWVKKRITDQYNFNCVLELSRYAYAGILDEFDIELLYVYAKLSGDLYRINDDDKLKEYLVGDWHSGIVDNHFVDCYLYESGRYSTYKVTTGYNSGEWEVRDGLFIADGDAEIVYVLSDNLFLYAGVLFARQTSNKY